MPTRFNNNNVFFHTIGDNKGRNHSLSMGFYLLFDPFVKEKNGGQSSSNREAVTIFSGEKFFRWEKSKPSWQQ